MGQQERIREATDLARTDKYAQNRLLQAGELGYCKAVF
jgi:hypothetical protein